MKITEHGGGLILVVDDDPANLGLVFEYLKRCNFRVILAQDGESALELLKTNKPDIVLLDIMMPGMDGFEVCKRIKSGEETRDIPVIFMSALSDVVDKVRGFEVGGVDYLTKPVHYAEVCARLNSHITIQRQQKQLTEINANKDKLFSIISHDLRNPFMNINGLVQIIADSAFELPREKIKEYALRCVSSSEQAFSLLENLLEWSRIQTKHKEYKKEKIPLSDLTQKAIELFANNAVEKKINLVSNLPPDLIVYADTNMLYTVLRNLISNAIKFTNTGGTIEISAKENEESVFVSVVDSGIGISESDMKKIFKLEAHHSTVGTNKEKGTGLGLILCKEYIEKNGGEIMIQSDPGKGTNFTFSIPKVQK